MKKNIIKIIMTMILSLAFSTVAWGEVINNEITLDEAINLAIKNSKVIQQSELEKEKARLNKNSAEQGYDATQAAKNVAGTGYYIYDNNTEKSHQSFLMANTDYMVKQHQYDIKRDSIILQAIEKYYSVLEKTRNFELASANQKRDRLNYNIAVLQHQLGMITKQSLMQTQLQLESSNAEVDNAEKSLTTVYKEFNAMIGLKQEERLVLKDELQFEAIQVENIESKITEILSLDPSIINAMYSEDLYNNLIGSYDTDGVKKIDADKAKISTELLIDGKKDLLRNLYNQLTALEKQYKIARESLNLTEETNERTKLYYSLGMASMKDLLSAEADLTLSKQKLLNLKLQHYVLKAKFYKPWLI